MCGSKSFSQQFPAGIVVAVFSAVDDFAGSQTVGIVGIADVLGAAGCRSKLPSVLPGKTPQGAVVLPRKPKIPEAFSYC